MRHLEDLAKLSARGLSRVFDDGTMPDPGRLVGWEFRGYNEPFFTQLAGFRKFKKGFYEKGGSVWGYNVPVEQGALGDPWVCRPSDESPRRFGFYAVKPIGEGAKGAKEAPALLLDYGDGNNGLFEGSFLRDYVRRVDTDNDDLYLGKAYSSIAGKQIMPTFFIIERDREAPATPIDR